METAQFVQNLIANVGFPIACVCMMFYQMEKEREAHQEESCATIAALNKLENAITCLSERVGGKND